MALVFQAPLGAVASSLSALYPQRSTRAPRPTAAEQRCTVRVASGAPWLALAAATLAAQRRCRPQHSSATATAATTALQSPPSGDVSEEEERRLNTWDGRIYTLKELRSWASRVNWSEEELLEHWDGRCQKLHTVAAIAKGRGRDAAEARPEQPQVEAWRRMWTVGSMRPMWSAADAWHVHGLSGGGYLLLGAMCIVDRASSAEMLPHWLPLLCVWLGVVNAASGLQPRLLASTGGLVQALGLDPHASPKSGGFVNASAFFLVLSYQGLRVLPGFPMAMLDPVVGLASVVLMFHTAIILNAWVTRGSMHRVDALLVPNILNLPVAWQLLTSGGTFIEQMSSKHPGWPELFFFANFTVAWALSAVTFILSLHERKVLSQELRNLLMVGLPLVAFVAVPLRAWVLVPEMVQSDLMGLVLLNAPA
mmetsp:Transcript_83728/g.194767  ORF Transcript_83728/g.194767 Transcript_83728/m.194767 type:complete len:422 (+) Transcript_83728:35-1300(+)